MTKYRVDPGQFQESETWVIILLISILVSLTLFGVAIIFIYYQKLFKLYRFQQNFINGFTHELKTPIASLRLYLDTFKRYQLSDEEKEKYINFMINDTERLTLNVNQILQIAKIEDKSFKPNFVKIDVYEFINQLLKKQPHYFERIKIRLNKSADVSYMAYIVEDLFEMLVMNLITNAINHSHKEEATLEINFELDNQNLNIHFKDNGVGIEKQEFKNVFKKMYQIGKSSKGSGLGLYLSTNIAKIHKGKLEVSSPGLNQGACFSIKLPIKE